MFLIFGFGKQTFKEYGKTESRTCGHCHKTTALILVRVTSWFTLFFIPLIPYSNKYVLMCPLCNGFQEVSKEELGAVVRELKPMSGEEPADIGYSGDSAGEAADWFGQGDDKMDGNDIFAPADRYAGKNQTQIAYLEKLAAHEKTLEEQRARDAGDAGGKPAPKTPLSREELEARIRDLEAREKDLEAREKAIEAREKELGPH